MDFDYNRFQDEVHEWSLYNFGPNTATQKLCGIIEEYGELVAALDFNNDFEAPIKDIIDAIGDCMIYIADFTSILEIPLQRVVGYGITDSITDIKLFGTLCHHTLKLEQKIRINEDHRLNIEVMLANLVWNLRSIISQYDLIKLDKCVEETWNIVKQRDWKKNAEKGVV